MKEILMEQNGFRWNEEDRIKLVDALVKAGYKVGFVKLPKADGKPGTKIGVEVETDGEE